MIRKGLICSLAATSLSSLPSAIGFASTTPRAGVTVSSPSSPSSSTSLCGGISKWNEEYNMDADAEDEEELITKEMFMKDQLEPARRKKKGSKEYRSHDNRDSLPFVVQVKTPEPYQSNDDMMQQAKKNTDALNRGKKTPKRNNLIGMDSKLHSNGIAASIYSRKKNGDLYKVLGSFQLDKNTNCGDTLLVGEREFEVVTARSQFKYAGGKRFVMTRKILEVKEITRLAEEASLKRLMNSKSATRSFE